MSRSVFWLVISSIGIMTVMMSACQGDFDPPVFDNPRDPASNQLPPIPTAEAARSDTCSGDAPLVFLSWSLIDTTGIQGYQIYRSDSADIDPGDLIAAVSISRREFTDGRPLPGLPGLDRRTPYWYRVRALSRDGVPGLRSAPIMVTTDSCTAEPLLSAGMR
jgi:hypothetical protein